MSRVQYGIFKLAHIVLTVRNRNTYLLNLFFFAQSVLVITLVQTMCTK